MLRMIAYGDALGFPVESGIVDKVEGLIEWKDRYGFTVKKGEYSDDTQLTLSVARSIRNGRFDPEYFAYAELPLWTYYQRGGGKANISASTNMFTVYIRWNNNFYPKYEDMGGNGAVMRISPIVIATSNSCYRDLLVDVFKNTLITHGHPAAFVGSIAFAATLRFLLREKDKHLGDVKAFIKTVLEKTLEVVLKEREIGEWISMYRGDFKSGFLENSKKFTTFMEKIEEFEKYSDFCEFVGEKESPGFSISSVLCALFVFFKNSEPMDAFLVSANEPGTDTDTIASMAGALFSAAGNELDEDELSRVQDSSYMTRLENNIKNGGNERKFERKEVRKWAEEFHKLSKEGKVPDWHPIFGKLEIFDEEVVKNKVKFGVRTEEGQTIYFTFKKIT